MRHLKSLSLMFLLVFALAACKAATQNIPVSSNPGGATVYADGAEVGVTPCNVELEKTQAHIITFKKPGYRQADVQISRRYDTGSVARNAVQAGTWQKSVGASDEAAVSNALLSADAAEQSGDAYVLTPSSVVVKLAPESQRPAAPAPTPQAHDAPVVISSDQLAPADQAAVKKAPGTADDEGPIELTPDQFDAADREKLKGAGHNEPVTISSDQIAPEDSQAVIHTTEPATMDSAIREDPNKAAMELLEAGAEAAPTVGTKKTWKSSHTSQSIGSDGSFNQSTRSSSVGVGVSVNPAKAGLGLIQLLEDANKDDGSAQGSNE